MNFSVLHRYRLGPLAFQRGLANSYHAHDETLADDVLVEHVPALPDGDTVERRDYVAQYRAVSVRLMRLRHPNVIPVRDFGRDDDGGHFVVKQYDPGQTLDAWRAVPRADPERAAIVRGLLRGLGAIHHAHVLHRDVKPSAIYVTAGVEPRPMIDHFHLAVAAETAYLDAELCGTPIYLAPEILSATGARVYTRAVDVYAAGLVGLEVLSGRSVLELMRDDGFDGAGPFAVLRWVSERRGHVAPATIRRLVVPPLAELIVCATHPDPKERFADAQAFYQSLVLNAPIRIARHDDPTSPDAISSLLERLPDSELCGALVTAFRIMDVDPPMAVAKCRQIAEVVARTIYRERLGAPKTKPLVNLVDELHTDGGVPADVFTHFSNVRRRGNESIHTGAPLTVEAVLIVLAATVRIVSWHLLER